MPPSGRSCGIPSPTISICKVRPFLLRAARFPRHHASVILPVSASLVECLVPCRRFASGTTDTVAVEDLAALDTDMSNSLFCSFAFTQSRHCPPWHPPPPCGFYGSQLPIGRADDGQAEVRVANPPDHVWLRSFCFFQYDHLLSCHFRRMVIRFMTVRHFLFPELLQELAVNTHPLESRLRHLFSKNIAHVMEESGG